MQSQVYANPDRTAVPALEIGRQAGGRAQPKTLSKEGHVLLVTEGGSLGRRQSTENVSLGAM